MEPKADRPLCFLDVDGVLNTVCSDEVPWEADVMIEGYRCTVPEGTKRRIAQLAEVFDMGWCTTWEDKAHRCWHELIGVPAEPEWPHVAWRKRHFNISHPDVNKILGLLDLLEERGWTGRRWVWIDDDGGFWTDEARRTHQLEVPPEGLILQPELEIGLADEHVKAALAWAGQETAV